MIQRILFVILFIPLVLLTLVIQVPYEIFKWVITGKEWNDPVVFIIKEKYFDEYL